MEDSVLQQATNLVKIAVYKLVSELSTIQKCYVSDFYNYILTGHNPDEMFMDSRTCLLERLCSIIKRIITDGLNDASDREKITEEKIEQSAFGFTNQFLSIYLNENTFHIHRWEGATPLVEDSCVIIYEKYDTDVVNWLRTIGYNILLKKY